MYVNRSRLMKDLLFILIQLTTEKENKKIQLMWNLVIHKKLTFKFFDVKI